MPTSPRVSNPWLLPLLAVLLAAQLLTLGHATTHGFSADSDQCTICLRAGQHKSTAIDSTPPAPTPTAADAAQPFILAALRAAEPIGLRARGPPAPNLA